MKETTFCQLVKALYLLVYHDRASDERRGLKGCVERVNAEELLEEIKEMVGESVFQEILLTR